MIVESITYKRSEIGAIMNISGHLGEKMSADDIDFITALEADVNFGDDTISVTNGGMMCFNAEGENIYFEEADGRRNVPDNPFDGRRQRTGAVGEHSV